MIITNFANQMLSLYHNEGNGLFVDEAPHSDVGRATLITLGFGCFFFDYDNDGWPDIFDRRWPHRRPYRTRPEESHLRRAATSYSAISGKWQVSKKSRPNR